MADTHDLAASFGILAPKLLSWHGLEGVDALPPSIDLEESSVPLRDAAQARDTRFSCKLFFLTRVGIRGTASTLHDTTSGSVPKD